MQIIPVIDLQRGVVVRGVSGKREAYQPITSVIAGDAQPSTVARALVQAAGAEEVYVADLDAIAGEVPAWDAYRQIAGAGAALRIDAGIRTAADAQRIAGIPLGTDAIDGIIAALETSGGPQPLADVLTAVGPERSIFSLDLEAGQPVAPGKAWSGLSPERIADIAVQIGFRRLIVLDVAWVGTADGPGTLPLLARLRHRFPGIELTTGGGIRDGNDLRRLADAGCDAVLVASALHDGHLTAKDLHHE